MPGGFVGIAFALRFPYQLPDMLAVDRGEFGQQFAQQDVALVEEPIPPRFDMVKASGVLALPFLVLLDSFADLAGIDFTHELADELPLPIKRPPPRHTPGLLNCFAQLIWHGNTEEPRRGHADQLLTELLQGQALPL